MGVMLNAEKTRYVLLSSYLKTVQIVKKVFILAYFLYNLSRPSTIEFVG